ncbi:hypothetical protein AMJ44_01095 [candidate division WOR-1 bacterium DG_54_3]|uniref:Uncharacterized protein n=1 Tax=candidate division WOR-1 bacterium DG_54_3 TaxID=1703775 RepID=A0A0S7Y5M1_UNCSA|nr:MAG: hypothetical protein AMJ44_01095 [candidate division WOR-1 bacterium DG_54_3]
MKRILALCGKNEMSNDEPLLSDIRIIADELWLAESLFPPASVDSALTRAQAAFCFLFDKVLEGFLYPIDFLCMHVMTPCIRDSVFPMIIVSSKRVKSKWAKRCFLEMFTIMIDN